MFGDSISLRSDINCLPLKELMGDALVSFCPVVTSYKLKDFMHN